MVPINNKNNKKISPRKPPECAESLMQKPVCCELVKHTTPEEQCTDDSF